MNPAEPPRVVAVIEGPEQRTAMLAAGEQLSACVGAALGGDWPIRLRPIGPDDAEIPPGIVLLAVIAERDDPAPVAEIEARWRTRIARYRAQGHARVLMCNLARAPGPPTQGAERLRRLKLAVVGLSRDLGVEVVDADRLVALVGVRRLAADPRGADVALAQVVGHALVDAILEGEIGDVLDPAVQARAQALHGGVRDIPRLIAHRLQDPTA